MNNMVVFDNSRAYQDEAVKYAKAELKKVPRLVRQSKCRYNDIHPVGFDVTPPSQSVNNRVEDKMVQQLDAQIELGQIKFAVELCPNRTQEILNALYFNPSEPSNVEVMMHICLGQSQYSRYKRRAYIHFTEAFRGY